MTIGQLRTLGALVLAVLGASYRAGPAAAQSKFVTGKLTGVVRDTTGVPQMGASVEVLPEAAGKLVAQEFLTNTQGIFRGDKLAPGFYTVRVTLAGFLPTLEKHVRVTANLTTVVRLQVESLFASLDQLRRPPAGVSAEPDDWKWVLRSAASMRPVLQWVEDSTANSGGQTAEARSGQPRARLEFTDGARRPGSVSNLASSPSTSFAYDQKLGGAGRLILAGQASFEGDAPAGGIATIWLPTGSLGAGPHTALVLREAKIGPSGLAFRGMRFDQGGAIALGDRLVARYGGEYVLVGLGSSASSLRPRLELDARLNDDWRAALVYASQPGAPYPLDVAGNEEGSSLIVALNELDAFPALMWRDSRPVLQSGRHEEISAGRKIGSNAKLQMAAFHDDNRHLAVFGRGTQLPAADYFQDYFSDGFAYDGGSSGSWGGRVAFREKVNGDIEFTAVYAYAGGWTLSGLEGASLRDSLRTVNRHSIGASTSVKVPRLGTHLRSGYKWVSGPVLSHIDPYGEALFQMDPYLHFSIRQSLPKFGPGHWEAIADCDNLLAQGYISFQGRDGRAVLVPAFRTFRGGLSLQF